MPTSQPARGLRGETQIYWLVRLSIIDQQRRETSQSVLMIKIQWHSQCPGDWGEHWGHPGAGWQWINCAAQLVSPGLRRNQTSLHCSQDMTHWDTLGTTATYWESDQEIQILSRRDLPPPSSPLATTEIWHSKNLKPNCQGWSLDIRIICPAIWNIKALERETFLWLFQFH